MPESGPYSSARAVDDAIKQAAKNAAAADSSVSVSDRIRQAHFDRFLCRVFSEGDTSEWLLKGGTGMLARVPDGRSTKDVDLYRADLTLDAALVELRRLASVDLGDHFRFEYATHEMISGGDEQPYANGYRVSFEIYIGTSRRGRLNVDLVVSVGITGEIVVTQPANRLALPRLTSIDYRLYPVVDQIADKVCATVADYAGKPSSREKDLVDLVIFALTHDVDARSLRSAVETEARRRGLEPISVLTIPRAWGARYKKEISSTPYGRDYGAVEAAVGLMGEFLDPVLDGDASRPEPGRTHR
jgi:hypothetical protein